MNRRLVAILAGTFAAVLSQAAVAWDVYWEHHRRVHYDVDNRSAQELVVKGKNYFNVTSRPKDLDAKAGSLSANRDFVLDFPAGQMASLMLEVRVATGIPNKVCDIPLTTNKVNDVYRVVTFTGTPKPSGNCQLKLKDDSSGSKRDSFTIIIPADAKFY